MELMKWFFMKHGLVILWFRSSKHSNMWICKSWGYILSKHWEEHLADEIYFWGGLAIQKWTFQYMANHFLLSFNAFQNIFGIFPPTSEHQVMMWFSNFLRHALMEIRWHHSFLGPQNVHLVLNILFRWWDFVLAFLVFLFFIGFF